jgi:single-strand DNA-binding protein
MSIFSINRVVLVGHLTRDPEVRALPSGASVCGLRVACNTGKRDIANGIEGKSNYFDVGVCDEAAERIGRHLRKGSRVAVDGRLDQQEWVAADRKRREAVTIVADRLQLLDQPSDRRPMHEADEYGDQDRDLALVGVGVGADGEDLAF